MRTYLTKTPWIVQKVFSNYTWCYSSEEKTIYLTFDDGPTPEVTDFVLDELKKFNAKATFFCVGENVKRHHQLYERILEEEHAVGNHTFNHLNGFRTKNKQYFENIERAAAHIHSNLFRPPYGKIKKSQGRKLLKDGYQMIMWSILSGDFDTSVSPEKCYLNVVRYASEGSIVVMHDSKKAKEKIYDSLPKILNYFSKRGYRFNRIA